MQNRARKSASLRQVAEMADVSVSTVSRYVNGKLILSPDTEARVRSALRQLRYEVRSVVTNEASVVTNEARPVPAVIGILVPHFGNPYFAEAVNELVRVARSLAFAALTATARDYSGYVDEYVDLLLSLPVKGLVCMGDLGQHERLIGVISQGFPVVVTAEDAPGLPPVDTVLADDYSGAFQATKALIAIGHRNIAFIGGPRHLGSAVKRENGWRDALAQSRIDPDSQFIESGPYSVDFGAAAVARLLTVRHRPTAVFAASDTIALGVLGAAPNLGIGIPRDLSIVGYDDSPAAALVTPRLTTVKTPLRSMAETSMSLLTERIADPSLPPRRVITPVSFVQGLSTCPPSEQAGSRVAHHTT